MLCGTHNIMQNIPHIKVECENIPQNTISPVKHCYEYE